ncbi:histidinol-phosphatase (PHP family) [Halogranum amylolyticum]|uniref:histidinol-phosphatase n=1 Tax=Halogranum amylolyticum TaxID=660520 RepID=A0A1H8N6F9_9EURY|nr:PHP domain-containing protein [Halogranum amylolyticum]SEO25197.1 histidinol-phosphatase (PHP family) [Halogranum amylolyticum]
MSHAYDYHVHSNYSDGRFLFRMARAAEEAGLDGVGFADHCNVSARESMQRAKRHLGFNLDETYERRREAIDSLQENFDVTIFDAVEMDYDPRDEAAIADFLDAADFDYAVGSVHHLEDVNVHVESYFAEKDESEREALVDAYYDTLVSLVDSELFEIAAHVDLLERNPVLRGYATEDHYERVAAAFADSRTVPEINGGRVLREYGEFHPAPSFREVLDAHDVAFTVGSDSHDPEALRECTPVLTEFFEESGRDPVRVVE